MKFSFFKHKDEIELLKKIEADLMKLGEIQSLSATTLWVELLAQAAEPILQINLKKIKSKDPKLLQECLEESQTLYTKTLFQLMNQDQSKNIKNEINPLISSIRLLIGKCL